MKIIRHLTPSGAAYAAIQPDGSAFALTGDPLNGGLKLAVSGEGKPIVVTVGKLLAPIAASSTFPASASLASGSFNSAPLVIGIGLNYAKHAAEGGKAPPERPMWFVKLPGSLQNPGDPIRLPVNQPTEKADYEAELAIVLSRECRNATPADALSYVFGYTCGNDVSARDWQRDFGGGQFNHAKSFDTFCPLGPVLVTPDELPNPNALRIRSILNGNVMQDSSTADMIFNVVELIAFLSADKTLPAGTIILTGTPEGVGFARKPPVWLKAGDTIEVEIEGIGTLTNPVV